MQEGTVSLSHIIDQVSREKGIDPKILIETMEQAILTAAKRAFGPKREIEARYNDESGQVDIFQYMTVEEEGAGPEREISGLVNMVSLAIVQAGTFIAAFEIVKERAVFQRERSVNLKVLAYLISKFAVLAGVAVLHVFRCS